MTSGQISYAGVIRETVSNHNLVVRLQVEDCLAEEIERRHGRIEGPSGTLIMRRGNRRNDHGGEGMEEDDSQQQ